MIDLFFFNFTSWNSYLFIYLYFFKEGEIVLMPSRRNLHKQVDFQSKMPKAIKEIAVFFLKLTIWLFPKKNIKYPAFKIKVLSFYLFSCETFLERIHSFSMNENAAYLG